MKNTTFLIIESFLFATFYFVYFKQYRKRKRIGISIYYVVVFCISSFLLWKPGTTTYYITYFLAYYLACFLGLIIFTKLNKKTMIGIIVIPNLILLIVYLSVIAIFNINIYLSRNLSSAWIVLIVQFILLLLSAKYLSNQKNPFIGDELVSFILNLIMLHALNFYVMNYTLIDDEMNISLLRGFLLLICSILATALTTMLRHQYEKKQKTEMEQIQRQMDLQNKYMDSQEQLHILKHDVQHILSTLSDSEMYNDDPKIQQYKEELSQIAIPIETGNKALNLVLNMKRDSAKEKGIDMGCMIHQGIEIPLSDDDLSLLMINVLDNAMDHIGGNKQIRVSMKQTEGYTVISVENTVDAPLKLIQVKDHIVPSDYEKGYGIKTVLNIVEKQSGLIEYKNENGWLICRILI